MKTKKSWRTTLAGWIPGIIILLEQARRLLVGEHVDLIQIAMGLGLLGIGTAARDNKVTSEDAGAK